MRPDTPRAGLLRCCSWAFASLLWFAAITGCSRDTGEAPPATAPAPAVEAEAPPVTEAAASEPATYTVTEKVTGLQHPTSLLFLPDGSLLVGERGGSLRRIGGSGFISTPLAGVPPVSAQGGLLDMALSPQFESNGFVFFSYVEPREDGTAGLAVARGVLEPLALLDVQVIYRQQPGLLTPDEAGGRLSFAADGTLFVGSGERIPQPGVTAAVTSGGELLRIDTFGKAPQDNPFAGLGDGRAEVWSYGHGSIQGLAFDPRTGKPWIAENWSRGGDMINLPKPGFDHGPQPVEPKPGPAAPVLSEPPQNPLVAPHAPHHQWMEPQGLSGMAFYTGRPGAPWNDSLFLGSTTGRDLIRLSLEGDRVVAEQRLLGDLGERVGDVRVDANGGIFVLTDEPDGKLLQIAPPAL